MKHLIKALYLRLFKEELKKEAARKKETKELLKSMAWEASLAKYPKAHDDSIMVAKVKEYIKRINEL